MKKVFIAVLMLFSLFLLTACDGGIPDDASVATCTQGDTFKYVFKDDKVYEFYSNDVLQSDDMLKIVQNAADNYDDFQGYLDATFVTDACSITSYTNSKE